MHQRKLPLAVQRLGYGAGHGCDRAEAVARKVGAVGGIYTDQEKSPPSGHKESAQPVGGRSKDKLEFITLQLIRRRQFPVPARRHTDAIGLSSRQMGEKNSKAGVTPYK